MRFLADMPISRSTAEYLRTNGHDVVHLSDIGLKKASDKEITKLALRENRTILTMDLDFAAILATSKANLPSVIIFRLKDNRPAIVNALLGKGLSSIEDDLQKGIIAIFEETRIRTKRLPI